MKISNKKRREKEGEKERPNRKWISRTDPTSSIPRVNTIESPPEAFFGKPCKREYQREE